MSYPVTSPVSRLDTSLAHSARLWNYFLGGKDHFAADRATADKMLSVLPEFAASARACRGLLDRAVRLLTAEAGIRQFIDIGVGLPAATNAHGVAQSVAPESRVVYVDNDPMVLAHARALLTSSPQGRVSYVEADLRDVTGLLDHTARTLSLDEPVGVILIDVLSYITDDDEAYEVTRRLAAALPSGSYLILAHPTWEVSPAALEKAIDTWNERGCCPMCARDVPAVERFFTGLDLLEPGVVSASQWRPGPDTDTTPVVDYVGVARKP